MPAHDGSGTTLRTTFKRLGLVALGTLLILAALDFALVRGPRPAREFLNTDATWRVLWLLATCVAGTGFFITLLHHAGDRPEPAMVRVALISAALAGLWLAIAFIAVVNFHLLVGGRL